MVERRRHKAPIGRKEDPLTLLLKEFGLFGSNFDFDLDSDLDSGSDSNSEFYSKFYYSLRETIMNVLSGPIIHMCDIGVTPSNSMCRAPEPEEEDSVRVLRRSEVTGSGLDIKQREREKMTKAMVV